MFCSFNINSQKSCCTLLEVSIVVVAPIVLCNGSSTVFCSYDTIMSSESYSICSISRNNSSNYSGSSNHSGYSNRSSSIFFF